MNVDGACLCGAITFEAEVDPETSAQAWVDGLDTMPAVDGQK